MRQLFEDDSWRACYLLEHAGHQYRLDCLERAAAGVRRLPHQEENLFAPLHRLLTQGT